MKLVQIITKMGNLDSLKIYAANAGAFLSTLTTLDIALKRTLIVVTIAYTVVKIIKLLKKDNDIENK